MDSISPLLVVGYGYLGKRLVDHCVLRQRPVSVLTRSATHAAALDHLGIDYQILDLDAERADLALPIAGQTLIYTVPPATAGQDRRLTALLDLFPDPPRRLIYISTSGVYGDCAGQLVDENAAVNPGSERGRRRVAAEQTVRDWAQANRVGWTVLRVPGIYGPHRLPLASLVHGEAFLRLEDSPPGNRIHVDDLVACCLAAADHSNATGLFNVGDGNPLSATGFAQATAIATGLPEPELVARSEAQQRISPGRWSFLSESRQLDTRRMRQDLGVVPRYGNPLEGLRASLKEMGLLPGDSSQG
ncbi:MAG: NAD-dependent epimerase/dehydratase family protein [Gammaproteobacteria bacterium]|nr:NAD-dependent epimerase/dehydratase family protein [Gammaproteobacteria bacterium]